MHARDGALWCSSATVQRDLVRHCRIARERSGVSRTRLCESIRGNVLRDGTSAKIKEEDVAKVRLMRTSALLLVQGVCGVRVEGLGWYQK